MKAGGVSVRDGGVLALAGGRSVHAGGASVRAGGRSEHAGGVSVHVGGRLARIGGSPVTVRRRGLRRLAAVEASGALSARFRLAGMQPVSSLVTR